MSLLRWLYYSTVICGWASFVGWLLSEPFYRSAIAVSSTDVGSSASVVIVTSLVGAAIAAGLSLASSLAHNASVARTAFRAVVGLMGGAAGGAIGGIVGNAIYAVGEYLFGESGASSGTAISRVLGFAVLGLCAGYAAGVAEFSYSKLRNGAIGGALGGLVGGMAFVPLSQMGAGMSGRATAFVILGICVGASIGLVQIVMKEAWLTVIDGYRPGRQLILSQTVTVLGRAEHSALPFIGASNQDLELEHLQIVRNSDNSHSVEHDGSKLGVSVNRQQIRGSHPLQDGDEISFGSNRVRFNERNKNNQARAETAQGEASSRPTAKKPKSPPAPPGKTPTGAPRHNLSPPASKRPKPAATARQTSASPSPRSPKAPPPPPPPPPPDKKP